MTPAARPERIRKRRHVEMLAASGLIVALAFLFQVRPDGRVAFGHLPAYPLPPSCASYEWFGIKCPGCGLTRSFVYLAHGDWENSWRLHRLGWLLAAAVLLQFPYRIAALRRKDRAPLGTLFPRLFGYLLIGLLVGNWIVELI